MKAPASARCAGAGVIMGEGEDKDILQTILRLLEWLIIGE